MLTRRDAYQAQLGDQRVLLGDIAVVRVAGIEVLLTTRRTNVFTPSIFELHGIDFLDANDGLDDLAPHQPDLRVAVEDKRRRLASVVTTLRTHGYRFGTLATAAESFLSPRSDPRYPATPRSWR